MMTRQPDKPDEQTSENLEQWQQEVDANPARVGAIWRYRSQTPAFRYVRDLVHGAPPGSKRCCYCESPRPTAIEHYWNKSGYPDKAFHFPNLLSCCQACNVSKGTWNERNTTSHQELFDCLHPYSEKIHTILTVDPTTGELVPFDPTCEDGKRAKKTIDRIGLNSKDDLKGIRKDKAKQFVRLLKEYIQKRGQNVPTAEAEAKGELLRSPYLGVFVGLLQAYQAGVLHEDWSEAALALDHAQEALNWLDRSFWELPVPA